MPLINNLKGLLGKNSNNNQAQQTSPTSASTATMGAVPAGRRSRDQPAGSQGQQQQQQHAASSSSRQYDATTSPTQATAKVAASVPTETREHAEALVRKENELKQKRDQRDQFEGLPAGIAIGKKMGDGAFSVVHEAVLKADPADPAGKPIKVAVKCVRKYELSSSQGLAGRHHVPGSAADGAKKRQKGVDRANILKEVQIMRGLQHPSIVRLFNFTESREHYYLTLELMQGGELFHQIVKLTYFSEDLSRHVIKQVAHGIRYLHEERGVVHRDIKPENILFEAIPIIPSRQPKHRPYDEEKEDEGEFLPGIGGGGIGRVKIADFGLSKIVWNEETMTPCGTVGYTAPEIVKDERYSKSVDMWALGCVLYTLLCGFPPFYDESINVLTEKVARGYYTFLSPWWDDISTSSKDLITHLLDVDPEKRYTIDEFLAHPWVTAEPAKPNVTPGTLDTLTKDLKPLPKYTGSMPLDSPLIAPGGRRAGMPSPGVATLKEAFDVTYAVHRMEEEAGRRRAYNGPGASGRAGFLQGLNEEDDESDDEETTKRKYGAEVAKAIEEKRREVEANVSKGKTTQTTGQYQGWGGADRKLAEAVLYDGRAGTRDRGRQKRGGGGGQSGFELSLNNATLLGRRKGPVGQSPLAGMVLSPTPGSPMRVD